MSASASPPRTLDHGRPASRRLPARPGDRTWLIAVLVAGLLVRCILVPITYGQDFRVWDLASQATLRGINVYAHHPAYPGGPYAYFPLFLGIEVPMQWLAQHTGVPFTVLGKLPIVVGDLLAGVLLAGMVRRAGGGSRAQAGAAALFVLNPLVVYNSAFYGRFDSVCIALFLLSLRLLPSGAPARRGFGALYGLAVSAKTFPIVVLPWLLRRDRRTAVRAAAGCAAVLAVLSAPYLLTSPHAYVADLLHNGNRLSGGLSWQVVLHGHLPDGVQVVLSEALLAVFAVAVVVLARGDDAVRWSAAAILLFLVLSKVVIEQYLTWPMPFLIVLAVCARSRAAAALLTVMTVVGMAVNPYVHPFGEQPAAVNIALAALMLAVVVRLLPRRGVTPPAAPPGAPAW